jgi:hypothetical protein
MENPIDSGKKKLFIVIGVFVVLAFVWLFISPDSFLSFIGWTILVLFIVALLFTGVYIFYQVFLKPQKIDPTFVNKERLIQSAKISCPANIGELVLSGDKEHSRHSVGQIIGWTQIQVYKDQTKGQIEEEDVFVIMPQGNFLVNLFRDPIVFRCKPTDHSDLVGDVVVNGFSLVRYAEYFYLNHESLNAYRIDKNIVEEGKRTLLFFLLGDIKEITDLSIGINPRHNINLESTKLMKIPQQPRAPPEQ